MGKIFVAIILSKLGHMLTIQNILFLISFRLILDELCYITEFNIYFSILLTCLRCTLKFLIFYLYRRVASSKLELKSSEFWPTFISQINDILSKFEFKAITNIVCFGLGHLSTSRTARYQLVIALLLQEKFNIKSSIFYDPCFTQTEIEVLEQLNCVVDKRNFQGKQDLISIDSTTLIFLPHCPTQLTNNILWYNWSPNLHRAIIIGNSITYLITHQIESKFKVNGAYIARIKDAIREFPIENNFHHKNSFNDTSIHIFLEDKLDSFPIDFWKDAPEPVYDPNESEIISSSVNQASKSS